MRVLKKKILKDANRIPESNPFRIFNMLHVKEVKTVIVGQDPYPRGVFEFGKFKYYYDGIAFSSGNTMKTPYSLKILKCLFKREDNNETLSYPNDLSYLVTQGVFLMNVLWSTSFERPLGHRFPEWFKFSMNVLEYISRNNENIVFILFGGVSQKLKHSIIGEHLILSENHPASSRYQNNRDVSYSKILEETNNYLKFNNKNKIIWGI